MLPTEALARAWADKQDGRVAGLPLLRAALSDHRIAATIPAKMREAIEAANYSAAEVVESSIPISDGCGVYFLLREGEITYVGQTTDLLKRLVKHRGDGRRFDAFAFIPCPFDQLADLERIYLTMLLPKENGRLY